MQDYEGALGTYEAALDLFTKTNNLQGQGTCKNNMGETYCEMAAVRSACCVPTLIKSFDDRHAFFQQDTEDEAERRMFFAHSYGHFMEGVELGEELAGKDDSTASKLMCIERLLGLGRMLILQRDETTLEEKGKDCVTRGLEWARK